MSIEILLGQRDIAMKNGIKTIAALILLLGSAVATADPIVFENEYEGAVSVETAAWCSGCGSMWRVWDSFTLSEDVDITQIDARLYLGGTSDIEYSIWTADRSAMIFTSVLTMADLLINPFSGSMESDVSALITGLSLSAGEYALSIWDFANPDSYFGWFSTSWASDGNAFQSMYHDGSGRLGGGTDKSMAFRLYGSSAVAARGSLVEVPEPGTFTLLVLGLAAFAFSRRSTAS